MRSGKGAHGAAAETRGAVNEEDSSWTDVNLDENRDEQHASQPAAAAAASASASAVAQVASRNSSHNNPNSAAASVDSGLEHENRLVSILASDLQRLRY